MIDVKNIFQNTHWTHYLTGFDIFRPENGNILLGWVGGDGAIEMESLSDIQIVEDCINLLAKFTHINVPMPIRYYWYVKCIIKKQNNC